MRLTFLQIFFRLSFVSIGQDSFTWDNNLITAIATVPENQIADSPSSTIDNFQVKKKKQRKKAEVSKPNVNIRKGWGGQDLIRLLKKKNIR